MTLVLSHTSKDLIKKNLRHSYFENGFDKKEKRSGEVDIMSQRETANRTRVFPNWRNSGDGTSRASSGGSNDRHRAALTAQHRPQRNSRGIFAASSCEPYQYHILNTK